METRGVRQQMRMKTTAHHSGELVVRGAKIWPEETADISGIALQSGVMLMQTRRVMMMVRGHQRMEILIILLLRTAMVNGRTCLLGARCPIMIRRTVLTGNGRTGGRHCSCRRDLVLLMLLMLIRLSGQLLLLVFESLLAP